MLSRDKDFLRYRNSKYTIYSDYEVKGDKLYLTKRRDRNSNKLYTLGDVPLRDLLSPLPPTYDYYAVVERVKRH